MRKAFFLLPLILLGCNHKSDIKSMANAVLFFIPADTLRSFSGNGSFAIAGDTIFISDYYYNYNDKKEISMFRLNIDGEKRILTHKDNEAIEISTKERVLQTFRRSYNGTYEEYKIRDLDTGRDSFLLRLPFTHTDHIVKTKKNFIGTDILGRPGILNVYDSQGKFLHSIDPFERKLDDITEPGGKYVIGQGYLSYNDKEDFIVYATTYTGEIFIYYIDKDRLRLSKKIDIGNGLAENHKKFQIKNNTVVYAKDVCQYGEYVYVLVKGAAISDNNKISYILRINKQGDLYVMKCYQSLLRIDVEKQKLYALAKGEDGKNVLVVANLDRSNTAN